MATQYIKYTKKCLKKFFPNYRGAMASFGQKLICQLNYYTATTPNSTCYVSENSQISVEI